MKNTIVDMNFKLLNNKLLDNNIYTLNQIPVSLPNNIIKEKVFLPNNGNLIKSKKFKKVSRDEYKKFVEEYSQRIPLSFDVARMFEPPLESYNDFSDGDIWPYSIVAKCIRDWLSPNGKKESYPMEFWQYYILDNK